MLYRVPGDPKTGYDLGVGTGTYGGYVPWVRTLGMGTVRVRCGYTVRVRYPYRTRTQKHVPTYRTVPNPPRYVHRTPQ